MLDISGTPEEKIRKFYDFTSIKSPNEINSIANEIYKIDTQTLNRTLDNARYVASELLLDRAKAKSFLQFSDVNQIQTLFFLTAAGAQLAAEATGSKASVGEFFVDDNITAMLMPNYAYVRPNTKHDPNNILVSMPWVMAFCESMYEAASATATQTKQKRFRKYIGRCIEGGAEESYHAYQFDDPVKWAELKPQLQKRYGEDWQLERSSQYETAAKKTRNAAALKKFYAEDPLEIDSAKFQKSIKHRIEAMVSKFLSPTLRR